MKFGYIISIIASTAMSIYALPAPAPYPRTEHKVTVLPPWNVTNFMASAVTLSHRDYFDFLVSFPPEAAQFHCDKYGTTLSEKLSDVEQTYCGNSSTHVSFKWNVQPDGCAILSIVRQVDDGSIDEGVYVVPRNDIPLKGDGEFQHQVYTGPENFTVSAFRRDRR
ncbi:hypothetical protein B0T17DRAFT_507774 [Bombardia bombarda]|uniref:Uncharacterized protein n=1 Tax=Bombardia bombarda TaxID=252184 RepID=A0AA40C4S0_9PEZI|nr:hypothetical protein B0T17DRAFT_507774 [Bombardia bombarda]